MQIKVKAPAKINLILEILKKREDGFHEIQSIMQAVNLYDYLIIDIENLENTVNYTKNELPVFDGDKSKFNKLIKVFYKKLFQSKNINHKVLGEIKFTNIGIRKTIGINSDDNLKLITKVDKLIENSEYIETIPDYKNRTDGLIKFHTLHSKANVAGKIVNLEIKIGEDKFCNKFYFFKERSFGTLPGQTGVAETSDNIIIDENANFNPPQNTIELSGNSRQIPYDKTNLAYKAAELFLNKAGITGKKVNIYLEKNIPAAAGLAGGSSDAAGTLWGLNKLFDNVLDLSQLHELASLMGSDLNFCLNGGTAAATSRGEFLSEISTPDLNIVIIKPKNTFISAKEAYTKYAELFKKPKIRGLEEMKSAISNNNADKIAELLNNHLEEAILPDYPEITEIKEYLIKKGCKNAVMSGSGPSVFGIYEDELDLSEAKPDWECFKVKTVSFGAGQVVPPYS